MPYINMFELCRNLEV